MRKTFQLHIEGKHPDRVLDATKHAVRKYLRRERGRPLPSGVDYWGFDCKFGPSAESAVEVPVGALIQRIDDLAREGGTQCYVEILACHGHWQAPPAKDAAEPGADD
ncbi:DUF6172 family protein [Pulveribacter suum]|uniref:Uncharacterized protein n=1 Tax=Pulveribacter suum TaxID=2116657 RepID=A0A2P1NL74_9BURK|nr:DUF6172 family protein [Pulveribacter suum]AVP57804.1 hypothetical protein C7H73_09145 [Pulveribacter suum]